MIIEDESEHASTCLSKFHQSDFFVVPYGFLKYTTLSSVESDKWATQLTRVIFDLNSEWVVLQHKFPSKKLSILRFEFSVKTCSLFAMYTFIHTHTPCNDKFLILQIISQVAFLTQTSLSAHTWCIYPYLKLLNNIPIFICNDTTTNL